jgi:hypothetical protein
MIDLDRTLAQIGTLTADILKMPLWRAVRAQRQHGDSDSGKGLS